MYNGVNDRSVKTGAATMLYTNDLKTVVPNGVEVTMFADDVSLFCSHPRKLTTQANIAPKQYARSRYKHRGVEQTSQNDAQHREV